MASNAVDKHLKSAWEKARQLSEFGMYELIDFIEFLTEREKEERWEPDEAELASLRAFFAGKAERGTVGQSSRFMKRLGESSSAGGAPQRCVQVTRPSPVPGCDRIL
jgi:hypothetical protein